MIGLRQRWALALPLQLCAIVKAATTQKNASSFFTSGSTWQSAQHCQKINESAIFKGKISQFDNLHFKLHVPTFGLRQMSQTNYMFVLGLGMCHL